MCDTTVAMDLDHAKKHIVVGAEVQYHATDLGCISPLGAPCSNRHMLRRAACRAGEHAVKMSSVTA